MDRPAEADTDLDNNDITAHASNTTSLFFQYFSNAQYKGHEGEKIASSSTTRYVAIKIIDSNHVDVGKIAIYSYTTNNGKNPLRAGMFMRVAFTSIPKTEALTTLYRPKIHRYRSSL